MLSWLLAIALAPQLTRAPQLIEPVTPIHPSEPAAARTQAATVTLVITIDGAGVVTRVDVKQTELKQANTDGADPDDAVRHAFAWQAMGAATQLRFVPALIDDVPGAVTLTQTIGFEPTIEAPPTTTMTTPSTTPSTTPTSTALLDAAMPTGKLVITTRSQGTVQPLPAQLVVRSNRPDEERAARAAQPGHVEDWVVTADDRGHVDLVLVEGPWHIDVGSQSHETRSIDVYVEAGSTQAIDMALLPKDTTQWESVVRAQRSPPPVSRITLSRAEVTGIAGTFGDTLRVLESLPGVARAPLLGGALMVRGGLPADTQVMVEGVPLPTLYHFGGLRSVVHSAFVEEIQFMPGGFPARYGNATAGAIDVITHDLNADPFELQVSVDLLDVGFFFGGTSKLSDLGLHIGDWQIPDVKFGFAARRSHAEIPGGAVLAGARAFSLPLEFLPIPTWYDWQAKLEAKVLPNLTVSVFGFGAEDAFSFLGEVPEGFSGFVGPDGEEVSAADLVNSILGNRFNRGMVRLAYQPIAPVLNTAQAFVGQTRRGLLADGVVVPLFAGDVLAVPQDQLDWGVRDDLRITLHNSFDVRMGLDAQQSTTTVQRLNIGGVDPQSDDLLATANAYMSFAGAYAEATWKWEGLSLTPGVRAEYSGIEVRDNDAVFAGKDAAIVTQLSIDPRLQARYKIADLLTLKMGGGVFHQRPRLNAVAYDTDGDGLRHPGAVHAVVGFESVLWRDLSLDVQAYLNRRFDSTRDRNRLYRPGVYFQPSLPILGSFDSEGTGQTQGVEVLLRMKPGRFGERKFFGWLAYTFSRTTVSLGDKREPITNFAFDQTHNFVAVGKVTLPWSIVAGARFTFVTGNPNIVPDVVSIEHDLNNNSYVPVLSSLQPSRLQPFHRLDLRVERTFVFDWVRVNGFIDIVNVYNWLNPEIVVPDAGDYRQRSLRTLLPGIPFLPLFGVEMTL
jgi:hypothetical protein